MAVLADEYGPFNVGPGASVGETQWGHIYESLASEGVSPRVLNELRVTQRAAGANMSVDVASGQAFVHGHQGRWAGVTNLTIAANASGTTRYDQVIVRSDRTLNTVVLDVLQGAAGIPAVLTQNEVIWESHVATVTVAVGASTIVNADVLYVPQWAAARTSAPSGLAGIDNSGGPVALPTGVLVVLNLQTPQVDTGGYWSSVHPSRFSVSQRGLYMVGAQIQIDRSNGGTNAAAAIGKGLTSVSIQQDGGTTIFDPQEWRFGAVPIAGTGSPLTSVPTAEIFSIAGPVPMVATEYVEVTVFQYSGVPMTILNGTLWIVNMGVA